MSFISKSQWIEEVVQRSGFDVIKCEDCSAAHKGHNAWTIHDGSHFNLYIRGHFSNHHERLAAHQKIMMLFEDDIPSKIHALSIKFLKE